MVEIIASSTAFATMNTDVVAHLTMRSAEITTVSSILVIVAVWTLTQTLVLVKIG